MRHEEFRIGTEFWCGGRRWRCTDVGTRVVVGICLEPHEVVTSAAGTVTSRAMTSDASWLTGPPYAVPETVFDEYDIDGCSLSPEMNGD
jgi:hypothetical protein